jgi:hypothetical protein
MGNSVMHLRGSVAILFATVLTVLLAAPVVATGQEVNPTGPSNDAPMALLDDSHCPDNYVCFWTGGQFTGNKIMRGPEYAGAGWQPKFDNVKQSAKNNFFNNIVCYKSWSGVPGWILPRDSIDHAAGIGKFRVLNAGVGTDNCDF